MPTLRVSPRHVEGESSAAGVPKSEVLPLAQVDDRNVCLKLRERSGRVCSSALQFKARTGQAVSYR